MLVKQIKFSEASKDRLSRLKSKTGIHNWNVLCRWAFCYSIRENTVPTDVQLELNSNLEMSWFTFGGEYCDIYELIMIDWCYSHDIAPTKENLSKYFKLHLERGIAYLSATNLVKDLEDLVDLALEG